MLEDWNLLEQLAHFNRERVPERVAHAKGSGAFGYFEVTDDITELTTSKVFERVGKKTPVAVRFSRVIGSLGGADTDLDPRGFAVKFYTEEGIWDIVGNNTPVFFIRDPALFPDLIHSQKPNPVVNARDWNMYWDFLSLRPESVHQVLILFGDRGLPKSYRHMHGYGSHTFSLVDKNKKLTYVKFHFRTDQGIQNLSPALAQQIAGQEPNYYGKDLYNAIAEGRNPSWTLYIQKMSEEETKQCKFDPFDVTKVWSTSAFPLIRVGKMVLNRNPSNYFAEVEQIAFSPSNITPGIWTSPDRLLQGRLFAYADSHRHRLGINFAQLPVNSPFKAQNYERDGTATIANQGGAPNYYPNSFCGPKESQRARDQYPLPYSVNGTIDYFDNQNEDNYSQPRDFYNRVLDQAGRDRIEDHLVSTIKLVTDEKVKANVVSMFEKVDAVFGRNIRDKLRAAARK